MKYKNIELSENTEDELFCNVEFSNDAEDGEIVGDVGDKISEAFKDFDGDFYIEPVTPDTIEVRSPDITLDEDGVTLLKQMYDKLVSLNLDAEITVGVTVGGDEWFKRKDGSEYNLDSQPWEAFIENICY